MLTASGESIKERTTAAHRLEEVEERTGSDLVGPADRMVSTRGNRLMTSDPDQKLQLLQWL